MTFTNRIQTIQRLSKRLVTLPALEHLRSTRKWINLEKSIIMTYWGAALITALNNAQLPEQVYKCC